MVVLVLAFLTFGAVDYWVVLAKHQYAEHLMHRYLQRMQVEGRLSSADEAALLNDFQRFSCPVTDLAGTYPRESQGQPRVLRNPQDLDGSAVRLRIACRPVPQPLLSGRLIRGATAGSDFRIVVGGSMLSERVTP